MELRRLSVRLKENASEGERHAGENRISHSFSGPCMIGGDRQQSKPVSAESHILWKDSNTIIWIGWNSSSSVTGLHSNVRTEMDIKCISPYGSKLPSVLLKYFRQLYLLPLNFIVVDLAFHFTSVFFFSWFSFLLQHVLFSFHIFWGSLFCWTIEGGWTLQTYLPVLLKWPCFNLSKNSSLREIWYQVD